ncbi:MAG: hypothetical protein DWQ06_02100 [Calditrichaeota bacterium]|nr:MAG: hypothetical protein DWQ06_02100 [Calditrichota bacterium]
MNFSLKIVDVKSIYEISSYWTNEDYVSLLEELDYSDAKSASPSELRELLEMAISDFEPNESAEILLKYKLKDFLTNGQIKNLSHEMVEDNESEEYPNIALHYPLFNINQLLYSSYNGTFQKAKATKIEFELIFKEEKNIVVTKELALKALSKGLSNKILMQRLYEDQLNGKEKFVEADNVIWELHNNGQNKFTIITSDYWINDEDINEYEFSGSIKKFEAKNPKPN